MSDFAISSIPLFSDFVDVDRYKKPRRPIDVEWLEPFGGIIFRAGTLISSNWDRIYKTKDGALLCWMDADPYNVKICYPTEGRK